MNKLRELKNLRSPLGTFATWNTATNPDGYDASGKFYKANYWYNFFTYFDNIDDRRVTDRLYGDVYLKYAINKNFNVKATIRKNQFNTAVENITKSNLQTSAVQTGLFASYGTSQSRSDIMNYELIANYTNKFLGKLDVSATVGGNWNRTRFQDVSMSTKNGLNVPELYAITNSKDAINYGNTRQTSEVRSLFATGDFEWNKFLSLTWAVRNDWYSTLFKGNNRLLSPQVGAGFVFSEFTKESLPWLSFGKVYGSWGRKPTSIGVYSSNFLYSVGANQWSGNILMTTPNQLVDPNLKGSLVTTYEFGFDLRFLKNRLSLSANYYIEDNDGEPLSVAISGVAGFTSKLINAAEIKRQGFEVVLNAKPFANVKNFSWDITKTFGYVVKNPVVKLSEGQSQILFARGASFSGFTAPGAFFEVGKDWGQLIGMGIKRNDAGLPMIKTNGTYLNDPTKHWGSVAPHVTGGLVNALTYKDFSLNFSIDYQVGGKFFSLSEMWGNYSGLLAPTALVNDRGMNVRDDVADGGGVHVVGVAAADGKTPVDMYVDAQTYFHSLFSNNVIEPYIHSLTFVKLRQIALGYNIPVQKMKIGKMIKGATISIISGNTCLIYRETKNFDPSEINGIQGEDGQLPGTRSLGGSLKLRF
jgi:outer membrane receptor protein involved in Fe transport